MNFFCRICKNNKKNKSIFPKELNLGTREEFEYIICNQCHSLSIGEIPHNLDKHYEKYPSLEAHDKALTPLKKLLYKQSILGKNKASRYVLNIDQSYDSLKLKSLFSLDLSLEDKILDVGCGSGELVGNLSSIGFKNMVGIDPFLKSKELSLGTALLKRTSIFDLQETFDLIMFHHSIEHIEEIRLIPKKISSLLNPGGKCLIRIPNIESFSFEYFKEAWEGIHPPYHITLPSKKGVSLLFKETPLTIRKVLYEQPLQLVFHSLNRQVNISDFDQLGARLFYSRKKTYLSSPPLFTHQEFKQWKRKAKLIAKTHLTDYVNYYLEKR